MVTATGMEVVRVTHRVSDVCVGNVAGCSEWSRFFGEVLWTHTSCTGSWHQGAQLKNTVDLNAALITVCSPAWRLQPERHMWASLNLLDVQFAPVSSLVCSNQPEEEEADELYKPFIVKEISLIRAVSVNMLMAIHLKAMSHALFLNHLNCLLLFCPFDTPVVKLL